MTAENLDKQLQEEEQVRGVNRIALDSVEFGDESTTVERVSKRLPKGITSRMLYSDVVRIAWPSR